VRTDLGISGAWISTVSWRRKGRLELYENLDALGSKEVKRKYDAQGREYRIARGERPSPAASFSEPSKEHFGARSLPNQLAYYLFEGAPEEVLDQLSESRICIPWCQKPRPLHAEFAFGPLMFINGNSDFSAVLGVRERKEK
jgi:hypothetical protein